MEERLQKILSAAGLCSRRTAETWLTAGRVTVNGVPAALGDKADAEKDAIAVDGKPLPKAESFRYLMLHKPRGYVTTLSDERGRKIVADLVADAGVRVYPVGRLDRDSEGLLLLTNDGALCHRIILPGSGVQKEYYIEVTGTFRPDTRERFRAGITVDNGLTCRPADIEIAPDGRSARVWVTEGKRHQVKRMAAAAGARVRYLKRLAIGGLRLDDSLAPGEFRPLTEDELAAIFR